MGAHAHGRPRRRKRKPQVLSGAALLALPIALAFLACSRTDGRFRIVDRTTASVIEADGRSTITTSCRLGEQMLGGGYVLEAPTLDAGNPIAIEARRKYA